MNARIRSARCWSCLVTLPRTLTEQMFSCQVRAPYPRRVPLDPAVVGPTLLDYGARTFWALLVGAVTLLVARAVRSVPMRALARHRAHGNVTVLLGNLSQPAVIIIGALAVIAIYTRD